MTKVSRLPAGARSRGPAARRQAAGYRYCNGLQRYLDLSGPDGVDPLLRKPNSCTVPSSDALLTAMSHCLGVFRSSTTSLVFRIIEVMTTYQAADRGPRPRILVVDDEPEIRDFVIRALLAAGYTVDSATNGADGLTQLADHGYALVILDLVMPEAAGR